MSKVLPYSSTVVGAATKDMWLVYNSTPTPKKVTEAGHSLGGKERAWVTNNDPVLLAAIESGTIRLVWDGKVIDVQAEQKSAQTPAPATTTRKRKPKKSASGK